MQFERMNDNIEDLAEPEDDLESIESHNLVNRSLQQSHEELEEDLLAPKLSILAASSSATMDSDRLIVSTMPETGSVLGSGLVSGGVGGGSRRKSPVRPMQVLRTKSTNQSTVSNVSNNLQSSALATAVDSK